MSLAKLSFAVEDERCDRVPAENGCQVGRPQGALLHQIADDAQRIAGGQGIDTVVVLLDESGEKRVERLFLGAGFAVRDGAAEPLHHLDEVIEFGVGLDAFGQRFVSSFPYLAGLSLSTISSIPPGRIPCESVRP
jgi:hypothetical protein